MNNLYLLQFHKYLCCNSCTLINLKKRFVAFQNRRFQASQFTKAYLASDEICKCRCGSNWAFVINWSSDIFYLAGDDICGSSISLPVSVHSSTITKSCSNSSLVSDVTSVVTSIISR